MNGLRLAYVVNMFPKVSETFIASEIGELIRRGVSCRILSLKRPTETVRHPIVQRMGLERLVAYDREAFAADLRHDLPHLVHAHFATEPTRVARALASELGVPFSFTTHAYDIYRKAPADIAERARAASAVITVSEANAEHMESQFGIHRSRVRVIPCGVDLDHFQPSASTPATPTIVCIARLRPVKNLSVLLRACRLLSDHEVPYAATIIGEGPSRLELMAERDALGLKDSVTFAGALDQNAVLAWWQRATVAVLTSASEGMPVSLMEAAACGVPAVGSRVGGVAELIADGVTGFVTEPGDAAGTAEALARVLTDDQLRRSMSLAARRRAETRFGLDRQVDALLDVWTSMVEMKAAS